MDQSWIHLQFNSDDGVVSSGIPFRYPNDGWVIPLVEPGTYTLSARLVVYNVPDIMDRKSSRDGIVNVEALPDWAICYNDTIIDGQQRITVTPGVEVWSRLRKALDSLPRAIRAPRMDAVGKLDGRSCWSTADKLDGYWRIRNGVNTFSPFSGCTTVVVSDPAALERVQQQPRTNLKWIRLLGDSSTRFLIKHGIPWDDIPIPRGTYDLEPGEGGTFPCIFGFNPVHGKDEQFLCLLQLDPDRSPVIVSLEWFTLSPVTSEPLLTVFNRSMKESFATAYHNASLLNNYWRHRKSYDASYNVTHTLETLLAPWPDLQNIDHADNTIVSFGSHNAEATTQQWQQNMEELLLARSESRSRRKHDPWETLTFAYTTAGNSKIIPTVRTTVPMNLTEILNHDLHWQKFPGQHTVRNNARTIARNELVRDVMLQNGQPRSILHASTTGNVGTLDFYGTSLALIDQHMHDAVHFQAWMYTVHAQLLLEYAFGLRAHQENSAYRK